MGNRLKRKSGKLLQQTLKGYVVFAVALLLLSMPFAYLLQQKLYIDDVDEALQLRKKEFHTYTLPTFAISDINKWNSYSRDIKIIDSVVVAADSVGQQTFYDALDNELEPYRVLYSPIEIERQQFVLLIRQNLVENKDLLLNILILYTALLILLLAGLFFLTRFFSRRLWKDFYDTLHQIEAFELGATQAPELQHSAIEEFDRLNQVLKNLIQKSTAIFQSQNEFIENAAHELQTPLAVLQAKLDNFLQLPDLSQVQMQQLDDLFELLSRLSRLNKNLLLLSGVDKQAFQNIDDISLNEMLNRQLAFFEEQAANKNINLKVAVEANCTVKANYTLVEILLSNLLLNAIWHNKPGGEVFISLQARQIAIYNTSYDLPLPAHKLFKRFAKMDSTAQGNGLGLAIVNRIAGLYHWHIRYDFCNQQHVFTLSF
jgi:signal transduction histidine kinase